MVINGLEPVTGSKEWLHRHYGTNTECIRRDVEMLKEWLSKQPHIQPHPSKINIDSWLENMLLLVKNSIARTKAAIDLNITGRTLGLQIFGNRDPLSTELQLSYENMIVTFLPGTKPDGSKVVIFKPLSSERDSLDLESLFKRCVMVLDLCLRDGIDFTSLHIIIDTANVRFSHLAAFNAPVIRALTYCMKAFPVRVTRINVVNVSSNIERMVAFFRPFISAKIMSRVVIHKQPSVLYQVIDSKMLPKDYGGDGPCLTELNKMWAEKVMAEKEYFDIFDSWKTDEKKRLNKSHFGNSDISECGSFRKLNVD
ncbi:retinol-binding protein pinta-like [Lycorma delicatula]|uniref:retinol-binding protein pinta-like n=1 Tax=Lycorma delicatula TaxID=130591 RepID=UPI003F519927